MERPEYSPDELRQKAERYCARAERCPMQVRQKLYQWGVDSSLRDEIVAHLEAHHYLDTARFCRAYVHDHYFLNRWRWRKFVPVCINFVCLTTRFPRLCVSLPNRLQNERSDLTVVMPAGEEFCAYAGGKHGYGMRRMGAAGPSHLGFAVED